MERKTPGLGNIREAHKGLRDATDEIMNLAQCVSNRNDVAEYLSDGALIDLAAAVNSARLSLESAIAELVSTKAGQREGEVMQ